MPGSISAWLGRDRKNVMAAAALVLLLALTLRLVHIEWSYSNNGIDEGIMLQRALLVGDGYDLYTDIPLDQAPLAFLVGGLLDGDIVLLRTMTALLSVGAIGAMMLLSRRLAGDVAMLLTGALLAADFVLLRESRLFSLDALCASFGAFSLLAFHRYSERGSTAAIAVAGLLAGVATSVKLLGGLFLLGFVAYIVFRWYSSRKVGARGIVDLSVLLACAAAPIGALMLYLGPSEMIDGMVFGQGHRDFDPYLKLSVLAFFAIDFAYVLPLVRAREMWKGRPAVRYLFLVVAVLLAFMVLQPLVFLHHMVLLSFPLAVLTGICVSDMLAAEKVQSYGTGISQKKAWLLKGRTASAVALAALLISTSLGVYGIAAQDEPYQMQVADILDDYVEPGNWVVAGDPIIASYAGMRVPPELVNVAYRQYPDLTLERIEESILAYNVSAVVVCYRLREYSDIYDFLDENGYVRVCGYDATQLPLIELAPPPEAALDLFQDGIGWATIYVRGDLAPAT
ncbi:MAG: glycosyltransferase family 39 protein [Thermoplasmata archaeon]|nr:glycosyltransferase family 39 protein [Thermoplasmata archaeon]